MGLKDEAILESVERIVTAQRAWMNDHNRPFYTVCLTPRDGIRAGTALANAFVCMIDPDTNANRLNVLLAHEMFHDWLLFRARVVASDLDDDVPASKWAYQWVDEGFTEYFARTILVETGLLRMEQAVALTNEDFEDYWLNEHRHFPYADLRRAAEQGRFMNTHQRIGYYRGALIALDWDTRIQQRTNGDKSLSDAMRDIIKAAIDRGGHLPETEFHAMMAQYGVDSNEAYQRYIIRGETPPANADAFGADYVLDATIMHDFAPGFDVNASEDSGRVVGVDPTGHAHGAGLRNGMELIDVRNSRRYDPDDPMQVIVRIDGVESTIKFYPNGAPMRVPVFRRADREAR